MTCSYVHFFSSDCSSGATRAHTLEILSLMLSRSVSVGGVKTGFSDGAAARGPEAVSA